jgi:hypothetical protein
MYDYEKLRDELNKLDRPAGAERRLRWIVGNELGIARTSSGQLEIFLTGPELHGSSPLMQRHLQFGRWREPAGEPFDATRIVLPSAPHFTSIAAVIGIELLRAGLGSGRDVGEVFAEVEPIIELAIRRGALSEETIIGLIGELNLLRFCVVAGAALHVPAPLVIETWGGWHEGRDFTLGPRSIEVKTTRGGSSRHHFRGLHQLEERIIPNAGKEELFIFSIGYEEDESGESLPSLVDQIVQALGRKESETSADFLRRVELYGSAEGVGYRHSSMATWSPYQAKFTPTFAPRLYRVADPEMRLLRREEIEKTYVLPDSVSFEAVFPDQITQVNPLPNWQEVVRGFVTALGVDE